MLGQGRNIGHETTDSASTQPGDIRCPVGAVYIFGQPALGQGQCDAKKAISDHRGSRQQPGSHRCLQSRGNRFSGGMIHSGVEADHRVHRIALASGPAQRDDPAPVMAEGDQGPVDVDVEGVHQPIQVAQALLEPPMAGGIHGGRFWM